MCIITILIIGCYNDTERIDRRDAEFICFNCIICDEGDYFKDTLIIDSRIKGNKYVEGKTHYIYYGENNPYNYEKCKFTNNGYTFESSRVIWNSISSTQQGKMNIIQIWKWFITPLIVITIKWGKDK